MAEPLRGRVTIRTTWMGIAMKILCKKISVFGSVILLAGCTLQQTGNNQYTLSPPSIGQLLGQESPHIVNMGVQNTSSSDILKYAGAGDGGPETATLTRLNSTQYKMAISIKGSDVGAGVEGVITQSNTANLYEMTTDSDGNSCYLSVRFVGQTIQIMEVGKEGCSYDHGASLSFDGQLSRVSP